MLLYIYICIYIYVIVYIYIVYIYICVKNIAIFHVEFTKKIILFSLFTSQFKKISSKKIHKHPACKMKSDEQEGAGRKFEVLSEHTF